MKNIIEQWYINLYNFADMAIRWDIEAVYKNRRENTPYSIFERSVTYAAENSRKFEIELNKILTENVNWKAIEIDLKDKFISRLNPYIEWYINNKENTKKFEPYNPYELMFNAITMTQKEILKYFPESNSIKSDSRYVFATIYPTLKGDAAKYELICYDTPEIVTINGEKMYISKEKKRQLDQWEIDNLLFQKIFTSKVDELTPLLDYQLNKYEDKINRLKNLVTHFNDDVNFNGEKCFPDKHLTFTKENYQQHCIDWATAKLKEAESLQRSGNNQLKISFNKDLKEYLSKKPPEYFDDMEKNCNVLIDKFQYFADNYEGISIGDWLSSDIEAKELLKDFFEKYFIQCIEEIDNNKKSKKDVLRGIDMIQLTCSTPDIEHNKNNSIKKYISDYLENIKNKIKLTYSGADNTKGKGKDFNSLHKKMINNYFRDVSETDFSEIMEYKRLPNGKEKISWIDSNYSDAFRFKEKFDFSIKQMNECFSFPDGVLKANHRPKHNKTKTAISKILKEFIL
jgi:hypothetical protein